MTGVGGQGVTFVSYRGESPLELGHASFSTAGLRQAGPESCDGHGVGDEPFR